MRHMRIGMAQLNITVGDFDGNLRKILEAVDQARSLGVDLLAFPEMATCGYPPEDLLFKPEFILENLRVLDEVVKHSSGITLVLGFVDAKEDLYNAAAIVHDGRLAGVYHKINLPNYGVFDEHRYFRSGGKCPVHLIGGVGVGINICEDIWYSAGPVTAQAYSGAEVVVNLSASPYRCGKRELRESMLNTRAADNVVILVYTNMVGGQDELVFDGGSMILDEKGEVIARGRFFEEDLVVADLDIEAVFWSRLRDPRWRNESLLGEKHLSEDRIVVSESPISGAKPPLPLRHVEVPQLPGELYDALVMGTRDYILKNGIEKVVLGLSGGIDSALAVTIAVDALGQDNVIGVSMPSRYSSEGSVTDAQLLAGNLGMKLLTIPIEKIFQSFLDSLSEFFVGTEPNVAEENIQSRVRGNLLMALSNKFGWMVIATGNKSETATGYCTLYGDMVGGFAILKDVTKTMVYELSRYRNSKAGKEIIPASIIDKAPSAELRPEQKDTDALPPYDVLDRILVAYVEEDKSIEQILGMGIEEELVKQAVRLVDASEYKRRQAPPGVKITPRAFGRDRRLPITNRFKGR